MQTHHAVTAAAALALLLTTSPALGANQPAAQQEQATSKLSTEERKKRQEALLSYAEESLQKLYATKPEVKKQVEGAVGYGVFDLTAVNVVLLVGQRGKGVVISNKTGKPTYMLATRAGTGPGLGYREIRQIFVFKSQAAMDQFMLGNAAGGDVSAAVSVGKESGQLSFNPHIDVYQITDKGLAVEAQWGGTVYRVDPDLN